VAAADALWVPAGYLVGTFPSALLVARARHASGLLAASGRDAGETDPHILMAAHLGMGWSALAATVDVLKGFGLMLLARHVGHLPDAWLALTGFAVVLGHTYPFYARQMAGRGLAAMAGVYLVLLPVQMVVAGLLIVLGSLARNTGLSTTLAVAAVPFLAAIQSQPEAFVLMSVGIFALLMVRRLEGVAAVVRAGTPPGRAILYRCVFDASSMPARPSRSLSEEPRG